MLHAKFEHRDIDDIALIVSQKSRFSMTSANCTRHAMSFARVVIATEIQNIAKNQQNLRENTSRCIKVSTRLQSLISCNVKKSNIYNKIMLKENYIGLVI